MWEKLTETAKVNGMRIKMRVSNDHRINQATISVVNHFIQKASFSPGSTIGPREERRLATRSRLIVYTDKPGIVGVNLGRNQVVEFKPGNLFIIDLRGGTVSRNGEIVGREFGR